MIKPRTDTDGAPRQVTILGSTGSVGANTIDLIRRNPGAYQVEALTARTNVALLAEQAREFGAKLAVVADPTQFAALKSALAGTDVEVAAGSEGMLEAARRPADWVMAAIVGAAGLAPTLEAVRRGAVVALANKECLVCAGDLMMREVKDHGATLLPVDSEHSAVFQVFEFDQIEKMDKIILTASGGPFLSTDRNDMAGITPEQAVAHPNWDMGAKISVDSATMMNKGLEVIEAHHLFALPSSQIEIIVHPQSIIHSMVAYQDGSILAQLGSPDMRTPIAFALGWPNRMNAPCEKLDFSKVATLDFVAPDPVRFPALRIAREALEAGGSAPTVLNAANEVAVYGFLDQQVGFLDIAHIVEQTLEAVPVVGLDSLDRVYEIDQEARRVATGILDRVGGKPAAVTA